MKPMVPVLAIVAALVSSSLPAEDLLARFSSLRVPIQSRFDFAHPNIVGGRSRIEPYDLDLDLDLDFDTEVVEIEGDDSPATIYYRSPEQVRFRHVFRMQAEFERQSALLVSGRLAESAPDVLRELGQAAQGCVPLVILVNHHFDLEDSERLLRGTEGNGNRFLFVTHDTIWTRDYGPAVVVDRTEALMVDAIYEPERADDDAVPAAVARFASVLSRRTSLRIPGGNLLTNGKGLCITTTRVQEENPDQTQREIADSIADVYGANVIAILEPLDGEATGHVDMFATFTDDQTVVVGKYAPDVDPENAAILDRNAEKLASIRVGNRRLRVVRISMPERSDELWPTFTNVVYANGKLLVPIYESTTPQQRQEIKALYSSLLPGWQIHFILADDLICCGGALHCVVSNLGAVRVVESKGSRRRTRKGIRQPVSFRRLAQW